VSVLDGYIAFLGRSSSGLVLPASVGVSVGVLYWLRGGKPRKAAWRGIGCFLAVMLSWFCMGAVSVPPWWPDFCVVSGWLGGIAVFVVLTGRAKEPGIANFYVFVALAVGAGYLAWLALQKLGQPVILPFLRYVLGDLLFMLAPIALVGLFALTATALVRAALPAWRLIVLVYLFATTVFLLTGPVLSGYWSDCFAEALVAAAPCVFAVVVFGTRRNLLTRRLWVVGLYIYVAALLFRALADPDAPKMRAMVSSLLSPQAVAISCFVLFGAIVVSLFHLIKSDSSPVDGLPLWSVMMPWLSIVPAFYFAGLGAWPFLFFVLPNLIVGVVLVIGFALRIGPFGRFPDPRQKEKEEARVAKPAARAARAARFLDLG
jgi:hypothetical protein